MGVDRVRSRDFVESGWDPTPGIVSVWAEGDGRAFVWRREPRGLSCEEVRFRPWILLDRLDDLRHLGSRLVEDVKGASADALESSDVAVTYRQLKGNGALRYLVRANDMRTLRRAVLSGASRRFGRPVAQLRELGKASVLSLPPDEQYLVASGRTYFRDLAFDDLRRMQIDLETTGLDASRDRIFLIAVRDPHGRADTLEAAGLDDGSEADLIRRLVETVRDRDPDVIENHNLHGFDLPFLKRRAERLNLELVLGRLPRALTERAARRGTSGGSGPGRRVRFVAPGRELIDTMDAVLRHDFSTRSLPDHGLKAVARSLGLAPDDREQIPGDRIYDVFQRDPDRVRRYACADVTEAAGVARLLGGAAFALASMAPRRYERLADAGAATGVIDPLLVRAYLRAGMALPAHREGDRTPHTGAALHLFAAGVARRVVKADVASLYPSLMRAYRIGPARDTLGALLALVDRLVERRLDAKARAKAAPPGSAERHTQEAMSAAMKLVVNSAYGYLAAGGGLTRFADVHAANEVTRRGRETLDLMCRALAGRGVTLLEADTDGVYFAVPEHWTEADERRVVSEVAALLPKLVQLEYDGRYSAMLSHEPKNYALRGYDGRLVLRGVAFRSSRAEPFGQHFLTRALPPLLGGDIPAVRRVYLETIDDLRSRRIPTCDVSSRVRLSKTPSEYMDARESRRELVYDALLAADRTHWTVGERVRVYRTRSGQGALVPERDRLDITSADPRDYDVDHYVHVLHDTYVSRLARAFTAEGFATVFADPEQPSLFVTPLEEVRTVLTMVDSIRSG